MSHLTDRAREMAAAAKGSTDAVSVPGQMFEDVLSHAQVKRRTLLRGGLGASIAAIFGGGMLSACGGGGSDSDDNEVSYDVAFQQVPANVGDQVWVPEGYTVDVLFSAGDAVVAGATAFTGTFLGSADTEKFAGGNHDGMHYFELPGQDPNKRGLLAINHEFPDYRVLFASGSYDAATATDEQKKIALSAVGISVIEVQKDDDGNWSVVADSAHNKRYTGNTVYNVGGPAAAVLGDTVVGMLNNCASGHTPWGTYLTCEESTDNYLDPTQPEEGYGWVVEIDPRNELTGMPVKRTALGRFDHENTAYMMGSDNRLAVYMGDDGTPGCIYKFVPSGSYNASDRAANAHLLDEGTLYVAKFNADGTGQWIPLVQGQNGLTAGATDPGNVTQGAQTPVTIDFNTQADVLINTKAAARVAGGTLMDRPEWITVAPDKKIYVTLTNNGGRQVTDEANPRVTNRHGHIITWTEQGNSPLATSFNWEIFLLAGDPRLADEHLKGDINGDTFSSPDGILVDPEGRLWVQTDASTSDTVTNTFGNNSMYYIDQETRASRRFLVGPTGCEITGLAYTPDLKTFFVNIQHPTGTWPSNQPGNNAALPARSSTIVVRHEDGKPIGA
ncbi:PhoX family phosphatase [Schlegelella sp. S2-27]|uniref:PhoX family phosphatase n=1 Tax=Caldimonas mangrovi TaxID=2944811 RepID=A0ABT0YGT5_9BURK|nr:PhoX family phosphatase [Caldimonas mangrovi]MCM5677948.1 PhoX family phosphatase [Caldimonas mangrovi]